MELLGLLKLIPLVLGVYCGRLLAFVLFLAAKLLLLLFNHSGMLLLYFRVISRCQAWLGEFFKMRILVEELFISCYRVHVETLAVSEFLKWCHALAILESQVSDTCATAPLQNGIEDFRGRMHIGEEWLLIVTVSIDPLVNVVTYYRVHTLD